MNDALNKSLIRRHEGQRLIAYRDTRGRLTIGVGCNLDAPGAAEICAKAGIDYEAARAGKVITEAQCDALFDLLYDVVAEDVRRIFPEVDAWPDNAGAVVCDMRFQLGHAGFLQFRHAIAAFGVKDWAAAAKEIQDSALAAEVPNRVKDNVGLLEAICLVQS